MLFFLLAQRVEFTVHAITDCAVTDVSFYESAAGFLSNVGFENVIRNVVCATLFQPEFPKARLAILLCVIIAWSAWGEQLLVVTSACQVRILDAQIIE